MQVELHCHSHYSRGSKLPTEGIPSPREIVRFASRKGIGGVALTDHNEVAGWKEAKEEARKRGILFIPGIEINTLSGHLIGLGVTESIPKGLGVEETVEKIREQGGIAVAPHPFDLKGDGIGDSFRKADAAEIFNSLNLDRFSNLLARKKLGSFPAVAGSDAHTLEMIGNSINIVGGQDIGGVLKDIRKGRARHITSYACVNAVKRWSYLRFKGSRSSVAGYVESNYSPARKWVSMRRAGQVSQKSGWVLHDAGLFRGGVLVVVRGSESNKVPPDKGQKVICGYFLAAGFKSPAFWPASLLPSFNQS
jgi:hypothetical protein